MGLRRSGLSDTPCMFYAISMRKTADTFSHIALTQSLSPQPGIHALMAADTNERLKTMNASDITKVQDYLTKTFGTKGLEVKARKQKDSSEVYIGEEFIGVVYVDEDEEGSYIFEMAILKEDL